MVLMMMIMELAVVVITNVKRGNALSQWRLVSPASPHARFSFFAGKTKKIQSNGNGRHTHKVEKAGE